MLRSRWFQFQTADGELMLCLKFQVTRLRSALITVSGDEVRGPEDFLRVLESQRSQRK